MKIASLNKIVVIGILFPLLIGCGSANQFQFVDEDYKNLKELNSSVMVLPFVSRIIDPSQREMLFEKKNKEHKPVTTTEIDLFDNYMSQLLTESTQAKILRSENSVDLKEVTFSFTHTQNGGGQTFDLLIPSFKKQFFRKDVPNFVMIFTELYFLKDAVEKAPTLGRGTNTFYQFGAGLEYIIWDVHKNKIAAFGKLSNNLKLLEPPNKDVYLSVLEGFASQIIQKSPFAPKKIYF